MLFVHHLLARLGFPYATNTLNSASEHYVCVVILYECSRRSSWKPTVTLTAMFEISNCLFDALHGTLHCDVYTLNSVAGSTFSLFCASSIALLPNCCLFGPYHALKNWCKIVSNNRNASRSQWQRGLRRRSADVRLLGLRVRILPGHGCLCLVLCFLRQRSLRRADHSSGGVLLIFVCLSVISKLQQWVDLGPLWLSSHEKRIKMKAFKCLYLANCSGLLRDFME